MTIMMMILKKADIFISQENGSPGSGKLKNYHHWWYNVNDACNYDDDDGNYDDDDGDYDDDDVIFFVISPCFLKGRVEAPVNFLRSQHLKKKELSVLN